MNFYKFSAILFLSIILFFRILDGFCEDRSGNEVILDFNIFLDQEVYEESDWGEPPQFAIWLEEPETKEVRTVFVTYRTATGRFEGKVECPVSLPVWIGVFSRETDRKGFPTPQKPFLESVTGATPKIEHFSINAKVPKGSFWFYYIEMNVSGDFNQFFPSILPSGNPDYNGNGQPSLIYRGEIKAVKGEYSKPKIVGRTDQLYFTTEIIPDLKGIDSAKSVFKDAFVICK